MPTSTIPVRHGDRGALARITGFRSASSPNPTGTRRADFMQLGKPNLFFGITGGNMDSMVNRYTADRRIRTDDAYTPHGAGGARPDRCVIGLLAALPRKPRRTCRS